MTLTQRWLLFAAIVFVAVLSDQGSKQWAEARLASQSPPIGPAHTFDVEVPASASGQALVDFLKSDLTWTPEAEVEGIARARVLVDGKRPVNAQQELKGGETLTVQSRRVEVVADYFHFRYTRNPGAAFSFLANADSGFRQPFFIIVSFLAVIVMMVLFYKLEPEQRLMAVALSLIVGGALGNFIDRVWYGWVIDFIDWHYKREYTWPTFNLADAYITSGVILMAIEILFGKHPEESPVKEGDAAEAADGAGAAEGDADAKA